MSHSTVTRKGQTTIPGKIRKALQIKPGDKLQYVVEGDHATIRVHPGTRSLKGVLASKKGKKKRNGPLPQQLVPRALNDEEHEVVVGKLLRSTSARVSETPELDYTAMHPIRKLCGPISPDH